MNAATTPKAARARRAEIANLRYGANDEQNGIDLVDYIFRWLGHRFLTEASGNRSAGETFRQCFSHGRLQ